MNDEFFITKVVDTGSEGSESVEYHLYSKCCDGEISSITHEGLIMLNKFLTDYLKGEGGAQ